MTDDHLPDVYLGFRENYPAVASALDGLGELSFRAIVGRDYPVVFATLYIFSLLGLAVNLLSDLIYVWIDPRIDFSARAT